MNRRRSVLLGLSLTVSAGVAACERAPQQPQVAEQPMAVYASSADCAGVQDKATCEAAFQKAMTTHEETAPKFASRAECEANFDASACQERQTNSGGSFFMPMMMGMMMGQMMNRNTAYPVTMDRNGAAYSGTTRVADPDPRRPMGGGAGAAGALPRTISAPVGADGAIASRGATTRGGFGRTASYRGSAGA